MGMWGAIGSVAGGFFGGPAGAAIGGAIGGAIDGSDSVDSASGQQAGASAAAVAEQRRQYDLTRSDYEPWRTAGKGALTELQTDINRPVTSADVMSDPGYQFGLEQGQTALDRKVAAMGGRVSGAALKGATRYAEGYATTGYNAAYQRKQDRLNRLASIAGLGQTATNGSAAAGQQSTNAISGLISSQGDASAAATMAKGNIWQNTGNQLAALYGKYGSSGGGSSGGGSSFGSVLDSFYGGTGGSGD